MCAVGSAIRLSGRAAARWRGLHNMAAVIARFVGAHHARVYAMSGGERGVILYPAPTSTPCSLRAVVLHLLMWPDGPEARGFEVCEDEEDAAARGANEEARLSGWIHDDGRIEGLYADSTDNWDPMEATCV